MSIFKAIRDQQQTICYQVCACTEALKDSIIVEDFNNDIFQEWLAKNPDLIHSVESSGNKLLSILGPISTLGVATN